MGPVVKPGMVFFAASICVCAALRRRSREEAKMFRGAGDVDRDDTDRAEVEDEAHGITANNSEVV